MPDKKREIKLNYNEIVAQMDEKKAKLAHLGGFKKGMEEVSTAVKAMKKPDKKAIEEFVNRREVDVQDEALLIKKEINGLMDNQKFWEGANATMNYFEQNWSY